MSSRQTNGNAQAVHLCYCPAAVRELMAARDELVKARTQLQQHDPNWNAIEQLRRSSDELREARELLQRVTRAPDHDSKAALLLERIDQAMPMVDYIADIYNQLREAQLIVT